eukprot:11619516-Alexandrium_andersonii.AAC.1
MADFPFYGGWGEVLGRGAASVSVDVGLDRSSRVVFVFRGEDGGHYVVVENIRSLADTFDVYYCAFPPGREVEYEWVGLTANFVGGAGALSQFGFGRRTRDFNGGSCWRWE